MKTRPGTLLSRALFAALAFALLPTAAEAATTTFGNRSRDFAEWCAEKYTAGDTILFNADGTYSTWLDGVTSPSAAVDVTQISSMPQYGWTDFEFIVRNGARLNVGAFVVNSKTAARIEDSTATFTATNGAVVNISGETRLLIYDGPGGVFSANFDHATLTNSGTVGIANWGKNECHIDWRMKDSDWTLNNALNVGVSSEVRDNIQGSYDLNFDFDGSNVRFGPSASAPNIFRAQMHATNTSFTAESALDFKLSRGATLTLDNCATTNLFLYVGASEYMNGIGVFPAEVRLNGGRHQLSGVRNGWDNSGAVGRLVIDGDADVEYVLEAKTFSFGYKGTGTVEVASGTLRVRAGDAQSVRAGACGSGTTGEGFIRVTGGTWINTNNVNRSEVYLGESGGAPQSPMA